MKLKRLIGQAQDRLKATSTVDELTEYEKELIEAYSKVLIIQSDLLCIDEDEEVDLSDDEILRLDELESELRLKMWVEYERRNSNDKER